MSTRKQTEELVRPNVEKPEFQEFPESSKPKSLSEQVEPEIASYVTPYELIKEQTKKMHIGSLTFDIWMDLYRAASEFLIPDDQYDDCILYEEQTFRSLEAFLINRLDRHAVEDDPYFVDVARRIAREVFISRRDQAVFFRLACEKAGADGFTGDELDRLAAQYGYYIVPK